MTTKRKPVSELQRPNRRLGAILTTLLRCPVGKEQDGHKLRPVAYPRGGTHDVRLRCALCGSEIKVDVPRLVKLFRESGDSLKLVWAHELLTAWMRRVDVAREKPDRTVIGR